MISNQLEEMLHKAVDGQADPQELAQLEQHLAQDAAARGEYQRLQRLAQVLAAVQPVQPPPQLKSDVLRAVGEIQPPRTARSPRGLSGLWDRLWPRTVYAFVAGGVAGFLLFAALDENANGPLPEAALMGMMVPDALETFEVVGSEQVRVGKAQGRMVTRYGSKTVVLQIDLQSQEPVAATIDFDGQFFTPAGLLQPTGQSAALEIAGNRAQIRHLGGSGSSSYFIALREIKDGDQTLHVKMVSQDSQFERTLSTRPGTS